MALLQPNPSALLQLLRPKRRIVMAANSNTNQSMCQKQENGVNMSMGRRESVLALSLLLPQVRSGIDHLALAAEEDVAQQQQAVQIPEESEGLSKQEEISVRQDRSDSECEWKVMPTGVSFCDVVVGSGTAPSKGNVIRLHYQGKMEDGVVFDSSYDRGEPFSFQLNQDTVMKGVYQAILGSGDEFPAMLPGGKRKVRVPPELGFGNNPGMCPRFWSGPCRVPANSVLIYDLEYLGLWRVEDDTRPFHLFT